MEMLIRILTSIIPAKTIRRRVRLALRNAVFSRPVVKKAALRKAAAFQVLREAYVETLQKLIGVSKERIAAIGNWSSFEGRAKVPPEEKSSFAQAR